MSNTSQAIRTLLEARLDEAPRAFLAERAAEIAAGVDHGRFSSLLSMASRHVPRGDLAPTPPELERCEVLLPGWNPERWTLLETSRVHLILARPDLDGASGAEALEEAFRYADEGELCALYRSLAHWPRPERFAWRAGEGCRTNMRSVFEAVACDTPYPAAHFDDVAWRQLVIKAIFVEAPLWRVVGLDGRLDPELARMALDLADERRSAGRNVQPELWLALGSHGGRRGLESIERELATSFTPGRCAAALALARAGETERLARLADSESEPCVEETMRAALSGSHDQRQFRNLEKLLVGTD